MHAINAGFFFLFVLLNRLETEAETACEALIEKALGISPTPYPVTLQTLASIRLSQTRIEDARVALSKSLDLWSHLPPDHGHVPDFATRISLARLLMEAEMEERALEVVERLTMEDDQSVEAWYLGGWCQYLMAENPRRGKHRAGEQADDQERRLLLLRSSDSLKKSLALFEELSYEDERLGDHARELVADLDRELGDAGAEDGNEDDEWEDDDGHDGHDNDEEGEDTLEHNHADHEMNAT
jgi:hypothetical protein